MNYDCIVMRRLFYKEINILTKSGKMFTAKEYERIMNRLTKALEEKEKKR